MENFTNCFRHRKKMLVLFSLFFFASSAFAQMSGNYTIDPNSSGSTNFTTWTAAVDSLKSLGVNGAVTFTVSTDTFKEALIIPAISGASSSNTITFVGSNMNTSVLWASNDSNTVLLDGADYLRFRKLTIIDEHNVGTSIQFINGATYNIVESCHLVTNTTSSNRNVNVWFDASGNNKFLKNIVDGGYYGVYHSNGSDNNLIKGNTIKNHYYYGFYINGSEKLLVVDNTVDGGGYGVYNYYGDDNIFLRNSITGASNGGFMMYYTNDYTVDSNYVNGGSYGLYNYQYQTYTGMKVRYNEFANNNSYGIFTYYGIKHEISHNKIYGYGYSGMMLYYLNYYSSSNTSIVYNNMVGLGNGSDYYGVYQYYNYNLDFYNNSIYSGAQNYGYYMYYGSGNEFMNNSLYYTGSGYAAYIPSTSYMAKMDYNNIYAPNSSNYVYFAGVRSSLANLKAYSSSYHQNTISSDPLYYASSDLHSYSLAMNNAGLTLSAVKDDYDKESRPISPDTLYDIGADDYYLAPQDADIFGYTSYGFSVGSNPVRIVLRNAGTGSIASGTKLYIGYSTNGGSTWVSDSITLTSALSAGDTIGKKFSTAWTISQGGNYNLCYRINPQIAGDPDTKDEVCQTVCTGLKGTYTINPNGTGDFKSFKEALDQLECSGVIDSVIFNVAGANYGENVKFTKILGTGSSKRVYFIGSTSSTVTVDKVNFTGASYITLQNVTVGSSSNTSNCVEITGGSRFNVIDNCKLMMDPNGTSGYGFYDYQGGRDNSLINSEVTGGYMGAYIYSNYSTTDHGYNTVVKNNLFKDQYYYGIYSYMQSGIKIIGNTLTGFRSQYAYGLQIYYNHNFNIEENLVEGEGYGAYLYRPNYTSYWSTPSTNSTFTNNMISVNTYYGIYTYYPYYVNFYHNSISGNSSNYGTYMYRPYYCNVVNNIFVNTTGADAIYLYVPYSSTFDYNMFYSTGNLINYGGSGYTSVSSFYSNTGYCANCVSGDPAFKSNKDLHTLSSIANNAGDNGIGVKVDIDGDTRPISPDTLVDIGADEFWLPPYDLDVVEITEPVVPDLGSNTVSVTVQNNGTKDITSSNATFEYSINGGAWYDTTISVTLTVGSKTSFTFPKQFIVSAQGDVEICVRLNPSISQDPDTNETICITKCTGKKGKYVIDQSGNGDFVSFKEAVEALECGITGPVTIQIMPGTYKEMVKIGEIYGTSSTNTIVFENYYTNPDSVILSHGGSSYSDWASIHLEGSDYVSFKNITIENTGTTYGIGVLLTDEANYNTISGCKIMLSSTYAYSCGVLASTSNSVYNYSNSANYTTVINNEITGGYYGIRFNGSSSSSPNVGNQILHNDISKTYYYGIYFYYQDYPRIEYNTMENYVYTYNYGIMAYFMSNFVINGNESHNRYYPLYLYYGNYYNYNSSFKSVVKNNIGSSNSSYAMYSYRSSYYGFYHNTYESQSTGYAMYMYYNYDVDFRNNIIIDNNSSNYLIYTYQTNFTDFDYNMFETSGNLIYYNFTGYSDLTSLQNGENNNLNSYDFAPNFVSSTDYHLAPGQNYYTGGRVGVQYDIDLDARCIFKPIIGADEVFIPQLPPQAFFIYPDSMFVNSPVLFQTIRTKGTLESFQWYLNGDPVSTKDTFTHRPNVVGADTVALVVTTCGGSDSLSVVIPVVVPTMVPAVNFTAEKRILTLTDTLKLIDLSEFGPTGWDWTITPTVNSQGFSTFDWVSADYVKNPTAIFYQPGLYEVCLVASNSVGTGTKVCKTKYIEVIESFDMCVYYVRSSNANGILYDDFGPWDGYTSNLDCEFNIESCSDEITVELFKFDLATGDYLRIYDGADANSKPLWNSSLYPNGMTGNLSSTGIDSIFKAVSGRVHIEFTSDNSGVGDGFGLRWSSKKGSNFVAPVVSFDNPDTICAGVSAWLENTSTGNGNAYQWYIDSVGPFPASKAKDMEVKFNTPGTYQIFLKAQNCGGRDSIVDNIVVIQPSVVPVPDFSADIVRPEAGVDVVTFTNLTKGCADQFEWSFDPSLMRFVNGTNKNSRNPQVLFLTKGCVDVTLSSGNATVGDSVITKKCYIIPFGYCTPKVAILDDDVAINRVKFNTIDNSTTGGQVAYTDYSQDISTDVILGATYTFMLERNTNVNKMNSAVWIDYNRDGSFDNSELVATEGPSTNLSWSSNITIPQNNSYTGFTKMRVGVNYGSEPNRACGPNKFGEYEDYGINIIEDNIPPVITLNGGSLLMLDACDSIGSLNLGATASDNTDSNLTSKISMVHTIVTDVPGDYQVLYSVTDASGNTTTVTQTVRVLPDAVNPVITLVGPTVDTIALNGSFIETGYNVSDDCSGVDYVSIISNVDSANVGTYTIRYTVYDSAGNSSTASRTIVVEDVIAPVVSNPVLSDTVDVGTVYNMPNLGVTDNYYTDLTTDTSGSFYTNFPDGKADSLGTFTVTMTYTDGSGNSAAHTFNVVVVDRVAPILYYDDSVVVTIIKGDSIDTDDYTLWDNYYPTNQLTVTKSGSYFSDYLVNITTPGKGTGLFQVKYLVEDPSGNQFDILRYVFVRPNSGLFEESGKSYMNIYPNPSTGNFTIDFMFAQRQNAQISIVNQLGATVQLVDNGIIQRGYYNVDLSTYAAGVYFVQISTPNGTEMRKLILVK